MCVAAAIGGAALVGGAVSAYSANQAAGAQESASNQAQSTQLGMYGQTNANLAPFRQTGVAANNALGAFYGLPGYAGMGPNASQLSNTLSNLPGYQFQLNQGTQAIDRSEASKGLLNSGATGKALQQYGQGLAQSSALQPYLSGLGNLANQGENAAVMTGQFAQQTGAGVAADQIYSGNAAAGGYVGAANGINSALGQSVGLYGLYQGGYFGIPGNYGAPSGWSPTQATNGGPPLTYQQQVGLGF